MMISLKTVSDMRGEIITFYSYKGGTGRSMAIANIACLLAERQSEGKGILMIDWDLEAPGLHKFFQDKFRGIFSNTRDSLKELDEKPGLIDLFAELNAATPKSEVAEKEVEKIAKDALNSIKLEDFILETDFHNLSLLKAGRFDEKYSNKVNTFDWEGLYYRSPMLIRLFAEKLAEQFKYILIDSRTGYTDISGICTMLMPQKLVVVFTPNRQNYTGIREQVKRATKYRRQSDDLRPLLVFPLPSRIEFSRDDLRANWRFGKPEQGIPSYQQMFEELFKEVYDLSECNLKDYFEDVQIQQSPNYAYGEEIAVKIEQTMDRFSLTKSYESFTKWLVDSTAPWQRKKDDRRVSPIGSDKSAYTINDSGVGTDQVSVVKIGQPQSIKDIYLFSWDKVPGKDNNQLLGFLKNTFDISWVENAKIIKSEDDRTIQILAGEKSVEITLNESVDKAVLKISDDRTYSLQVKEENGRLNIYKSSSSQGNDNK